MTRTALTYFMQGANDFQAITHHKNRYAIARAAKYVVSDSWQAKAYRDGLNRVGYEYRQGLSVFGPLKAMNDAIWCVTGFDLFDARRNDDSETMRRIQREVDAKVREEIEACAKATAERIVAQRIERDAPKAAKGLYIVMIKSGAMCFTLRVRAEGEEKAKSLALWQCEPGAEVTRATFVQNI